MEALFKDETYKIIDICTEVHKNLGKGFNELVYKDALEYEFRKNQIKYVKDKSFNIQYKDSVLSHYYVADFVVFDKILLDIQSVDYLTSNHIKKSLKYLMITNLNLSLLINFGEDSVRYERVSL